MAPANRPYRPGAVSARAGRYCTLCALTLLFGAVLPHLAWGQDIRTQEILFDDNAATIATRHTLTLRGPLDDSLTIDYDLLLPSQNGIGVGSLLFVDSWGANVGTTRWLNSTPSSVLTTDASGNLVWGAVSAFLTAPGEFADADSIGMSGFIYARQALTNGSADTVIITDDGEFAIGTTSPDGWLTILGNNELFRAKDLSGTLRTNITDEGEQYWYLGNPAGDFGEASIATIGSYPAFSLYRPGSTDRFSITNRSSYTALGYGADGADTGSVFNIAQGGNVGVGTPTPQNRLHVAATSNPLRIEGVQQVVGLDSVLVIDAQGVVQWAPADSLIRYLIDSAFVPTPAWLLEGNAGTDASINFLGTTDSVDLVFRTDNVEAARVSAVGDVGIGTTAPQNRLHVSATSDPVRLDGVQQVFGLDSVMVLDAQGVVHWAPADSLIRYWIDSAFVSEPAWLLEGNAGTDASINFLGTTDSVDLVFRTDNTEAARVSAVGDVGIGTNAPQNRLHVSATSDPIRVEGLQQVFGLDSVMVLDAQGVVHWAPADSLIRYWIDSAFVDNPAWLLEGNAGTDASINFLGTTDSVDLVFRTDNTEAARVSAVGDLGIGTNAPQNRLHVSATSDPLRLDGTQQVFGLDSVMVLDAQGVVHWAPADSLIRYWIDSAVVTPNAWLLDGNPGTNPAVNYVGTSDQQNLSIRANAVEHVNLDATTGETNVGNAPGVTGSWNVLNSTLDVSGAGITLNGGSAVAGEILLGSGGSTGAVSGISSLIDLQGNGASTDLRGVTSQINLPTGIAANVANYTGLHVDLTGGSVGTALTEFYGVRTENSGSAAIASGWGTYIGSPTAQTVNFTGIEVEDLGSATGTTRAFYYDGTGTNDPVVITGAGDLGVGTAAPTQAVDIFDGNLLLSNSGTAGQIRFAEPSGGGTNYSSFQAPLQPATINYVLPDTAGATGDVLTVRNVAGATVTLDWGDGIPPAAWLLQGNSGTTAGTNFLGTIDNQPLEIKVNSLRAMRYEPSAVSPNLIGGYLGNTVASGEDGNVIGGGGSSGLINQIGNGVDFAVIGGGLNNQISGGSDQAHIGGGQENLIMQESDFGVIAGGLDNEISDTSEYGAILGGTDNTISTEAHYSSILGGRGLTLQGSGSVGYLGGNTGTRDMTVTNDNVAVLGNVDLWLTNNDSSASAARFYEPNPTVGTITTSMNYTSLRAQAQAQNIEYVFPDTAGIVGDVLSVRSLSGTQVTLDWQSRNEGDGVGRLLFARKLTNETVTAGATAAVQNDDDLYLPLGTNRTYEISGAMYIKRSNGVGSFDIAFDVPTGCTMLISFFANESKSGNSNTGADIRDVDAVGALANNNYKMIGINTNWNVIHFKGLIVTGTTSGNIRVMWSPDSGTATVYTNSYIGAKVAEN